MKKKDFITDALNIDFTDRNSIALTQQKTLRKLVGILGVLLPVLLYISVSWYTHYNTPIKSISHYYFTRFGSIFIIIVSLLSIFLLVYKGKERLDFYLSSLAGLAALTLLLLPASNLEIKDHDGNDFIVVTTLREYGLRDTIHNVCGGVFLTALACMALFVFTKKNPALVPVTPQKLVRNKIYIVCGVIMLFALITILIGWISKSEWFNAHQMTFWMESVALEAFGFSWLVKGEIIFKDKK
ncbi:MAG TPA: hypothetical protein VFV68_00850 [Agriterribacter sp.]|nr:hypothetical protein [Agriterribacter sp.]